MNDDAAQEPDDPQADAHFRRAAARVSLPARCLLMVGMLNLLAGVYCLVDAIFVKRQGPTADFRQSWESMDSGDRAQLEKWGWSSDDAFLAGANAILGYGGLAAIASVGILAGGRNMLALRSYGWSLFGAVLTAMPCVTPCCLIGQVVGVWALIVLFQSDVRTAFP